MMALSFNRQFITVAIEVDIDESVHSTRARHVTSVNFIVFTLDRRARVQRPACRNFDFCKALT